jgi:hypothetical protein
MDFGNRAGKWAPGAQNRQAIHAPSQAEPSFADASSSPSNGSPASGAAWTSRKMLGLRLFCIGGLGFILPLMHIQFIVLSFFGSFEFVAAGAFVLVGIILMVIPDAA